MPYELGMHLELPMTFLFNDTIMGADHFKLVIPKTQNPNDSAQSLEMSDAGNTLKLVNH